MAMTKCKECGNEISTKADACPKCGAKRPKTGCLTWVVAGFLFLVVATMVSNLGNKDGSPDKGSRPKRAAAEKPPEKSAEEIAIETGTTTAAVAAKALHDAMRNPDSFVLEKALVMDSGAVCIEYRAQNGFGGMNRASAVVPPGTTKLLNSDGPGFDKSWNKNCAGKTGHDVTQQAEMYMKLL